jgi:hypothetical protein
MTRIVTVLLASAVLFGPGICLGMEQTDDTQIGTDDHIWLQQGCQTADVIQNLAVCNGQYMDGVGGQGLLANVGAVGHASSEGAEVGVLRVLGIMDWQGQLVLGPCALQRQDRTLNLNGLLSVGIAQGPGDGHGLQQVVFRGDQGSGNFAAGTSSATSILGLQNAGITGMADSLSGADTRMQVDTLQREVSL